MNATSPSHPGLAAVNLVILIGLGLSASWWVLYYTDWFPVVLGLIGLGGFFAWIALVINLLSSERKAQFQHYFDQYVLQSRRLFGIGLGMLVVGWLVVAPWWGTLVVDSLEASAGHLVEVSKLEGDKVASEPLRRVALPPDTRAKILLPTPWFFAATYYVKVSRLPSTRVTLRGLRREALLVPDMLLERPVILARPAANLAGPVAEDFSFQALVDGELIGEIEDYRGQPVWVAASEDTALPEHLLQRWRQEFIRAELDPSWVEIWKRPAAVAETDVLPPGATVTVRLVRRSTLSRDHPEVKYQARLTLGDSGRTPRFPEELVFREVH